MLRTMSEFERELRSKVAEAGETLSFFLKSGVSELGDRLGPILWQFAPTKKFDPQDFGAFLGMLPRKLDGLALRHAVEVRHTSFATPEFIALVRKHNTPVVFAEHETYPAIADIAGDFVYARLQKGEDTIPTAYAPEDLDRWAARARVWAEGGQPKDLPLADPAHSPDRRPRDVFLYFIHEGKLRAPQGAMAFMERV